MFKNLILHNKAINITYIIGGFKIKTINKDYFLLSDLGYYLYNYKI